MEKISHFRDLRVWQEGHKLVLMIYDLTSNFPADEKFGLISQMRRAVVSVTSNVSEGFGRAHAPNKIQFYNIAKGSLLELENQLIIAKDLDYVSENRFKLALNQIITVSKLLAGFTKTALSRE